MGETLSNLVESYGYVAVFVLIALESLGIPLPGESALVSAAAFAAYGRLSLPWLLFVAVRRSNCGRQRWLLDRTQRLLDRTQGWISHH